MKFRVLPPLAAFLALGTATLGGCAVPVVSKPTAQTSPVSPMSAEVPGKRPASSLVGLTADEVRNRFGMPDVQRRENTAELWQYADAGCVLLVYLYGSSAAGEQVAHVDEVATPRGHNCLDQLSARSSKSAALTN
jgi:hypothetical protein